MSLCETDFDPALSKSALHAIMLHGFLVGMSLDRHKEQWRTGHGLTVFRALEDCDSPMASSKATPITDRERAVLRYLYDQAGGWWEWMPGDPEPRFFPVATWERLL
jgi:hypothetical protein